MVEEGSAATVSICDLQGHRLEEAGRPAKDREDIAIPSALGQGSDYVQVEAGEPLIWNWNPGTWDPDGFPCFGQLTRVA